MTLYGNCTWRRYQEPAEQLQSRRHRFAALDGWQAVPQLAQSGGCSSCRRTFPLSLASGESATCGAPPWDLRRRARRGVPGHDPGHDPLAAIDLSSWGISYDIASSNHASLQPLSTQRWRVSVALLAQLSHRVFAVFAVFCCRLAV
jgi:hypothetical protein